jgi:hypothetical protein
LPTITEEDKTRQNYQKRKPNTKKPDDKTGGKKPKE